MDAQAFYDDLADDYDALHSDWPSSVREQGRRARRADPQRARRCAAERARLLVRHRHAGDRARAGRPRRARDRPLARLGRCARATRRPSWARRSPPASPTSRASPSRSRGRSRACSRATTRSRTCTPTPTSRASPRASPRSCGPGGLAVVSLRDYEALRAAARRGPPAALRPGHDLVPDLGLGRRRPELRAAAVHAARRGRAAGGRPAGARACARCCAASCAPRWRPPDSPTCAGARPTRPATTSRS